MDWIKIFDSKASAEAALSENQPRLLMVRGKRICLVRRGGNFFGVQDKCSHSGESLSKGNINYLGEVVCPLHQYQFNLKTGRESNQRCADLECFPVKENEDGIFIGL
ncbi:MAG: Rieske 2Fe-2S domain-containing protein [Bacteroidetes bacterium]|nr:Rieske 2Fe-2S domain-containing protein [Bacteroidota bacterium]